MAVQRYKNGGTSLGVFSTIADLESAPNLNGVDLVQKIGGRSAAKQAMATESPAAATQLQQTRLAVQGAYAQLTREAATARESAIAAQTALDNQIRTQHERSSTLVEQLAYLNDTTVAQESEYRQGQAAVADYRQVQQAKRAAEEAAERMVEKKKPSLPLLSAPEPGPVGGSGTAPKPVAERPVTERLWHDTEAGYGAAGRGQPGRIGNPDPGHPAGCRQRPRRHPGLRFIQIGLLRLGAGSVSVPAPAVGTGIELAHQCHEPLQRCLRHRPVTARQQIWPGGADWLTSYRTQVNRGLGYIRNRYGSPCSAWGHSQSVGWY